MSPNDPTAPAREETAATSSAGAPETNGSAGHFGSHGSENGPASSAGANHSSDAQTAGAQPSEVERAEEIVDRVAAKVSEVTSVWGRRIVRLFSRAKEEAEDIWGEAQSIRRGDQP